MKLDRKPNYVQRPPRWSIRADTILVDGAGRELEIRLWNISEGGFMAECEEKPTTGSHIDVDLPDRGRVRAEVRWALGWGFGAMILSGATPAAA